MEWFAWMGLVCLLFIAQEIHLTRTGSPSLIYILLVIIYSVGSIMSLF